MVEETKEAAGKGLKTLLKIIVGIALIVLGIILIWYWRGALIILIRGCLGLFLVMVGAIFLAIAKE